jgi:C4-dicarboxylate transporter DctM subunit
LFLAGLIPGLLIAAVFIAIIYAWARIDPSLAPRAERTPWKARWASLPPVVWVALVFLVVVGGVIEGFFTPSEAGAVGTFAVLLVCIAERGMSFGKYVTAMREALRTGIMIMMLIVGSTVLGHFIAVTTIPQVAADWLVSLPLNRYFIMFLICLVYEIGGSFIDDLAFMVLATPIFYPAVLKLGFDPIWFGIIIGVVVMIGVVIPPVAICVFVVKNITKVPMGTIYKGVMPFLISLVGIGCLLFFFPQIALWLPSIFYK